VVYYKERKIAIDKMKLLSVSVRSLSGLRVINVCCLGSENECVCD